MSTTRAADLLDRLLDPVAGALNEEAARSILAIEADDDIRQRVEELAEKCTEGQLTTIEKEEYDSYVRVSNLVAILKAKARLMLDQTARP